MQWDLLHLKNSSKAGSRDCKKLILRFFSALIETIQIRSGIKTTYTEINNKWTSLHVIN